MHRRWSAATAALASAITAVLLSAVALVVLSAPSSAQPSSLAVCTYPAWGEGGSYAAGTKVTYSGRGYEARVAHTAHTGAGWNPAATPTLWRDLGVCDDSQPPTT
ncbi:glycoside hydrolase family 18, partial [Actinomadura sp. KC06]|uniref:carbohydrate-binding protein n=1 Tax=Actinomadura sp. KC06 TaxID=2530369 RepID=UPI0010D3AE00